MYKQNGNTIDITAFEALISGNNAYVSITKDSADKFTFNVIPAPTATAGITKAEITAPGKVTVTFSDTPVLPPAGIGQFTFDANKNGVIEAGEIATASAAGAPGSNQLVLDFAAVTGTETAVGTLTYTPTAVSAEHLTINNKVISNSLKSSVVVASIANGVTFNAPAVTVNGVDFNQRVAKAQIVSATGITAAGDLEVTLTATDLLAGTPLVLTVPVALNDTKETVANKVRLALAGNTNVTANFNVTGTGAEVIVTPLVATNPSNAANTIALTVDALAANPAGGLAPTTTTGTVSPGTVGVAEVNTITFTSGVTAVAGTVQPLTVRVKQNSPTDLVGIDRLVSVSLTTADTTATAVAEKVKTELAKDATLAAKFDITAAAGVVTLTNKTTGDVNTTITIN